MSHLLELKNISKRFTKTPDFVGRVANRVASKFGAQIQNETVHAVDQVSLNIERGEVVGLVGESGCGKSTLGRVVVGIHPQTEGERLWKGRDVASMSAADKRAMQLQVQMIFQDPYASLNPRYRVEDIIGEAPVVHGLISRAEKADYVAALMQKVGLDAALSKRFPHQFSGGQRARIGIARALAVKPEFLVCDEAVAALDVSIQAQVLNLFIELRREFNLTYLFISHDLGVVKHLSDRVVIMYLGRVVEIGCADELFSDHGAANAHPSPHPHPHPYTQALLAEVPRLDIRKKDFVAIKGEIPSPLNPPSGCHFHPRCPHALPRCSAEQPQLREVAPKRFLACHLNDLT